MSKPEKLWKGKRGVGDNLRLVLPVLVRDWFAAGRTAMTPGQPWEAMHRFRLLTKRFRYTLEIFQRAWGRGISQRIDALRKIQTLLGEINDAVVTSGMLEGQPRTEQLRSRLAAGTARKVVALHRLWATEFEPAEAEATWLRYLTLYACRVVTPKLTVESTNIPEST